MRWQKGNLHANSCEMAEGESLGFMSDDRKEIPRLTHVIWQKGNLQANSCEMAEGESLG